MSRREALARCTPHRVNSQAPLGQLIRCSYPLSAPDLFHSLHSILPLLVVQANRLDPYRFCNDFSYFSCSFPFIYFTPSLSLSRSLFLSISFPSHALCLFLLLPSLSPFPSSISLFLSVSLSLTHTNTHTHSLASLSLTIDLEAVL